MAILDAYVTDSEYRAAGGDFTWSHDASLDAQLLSMSRLLERALGVMPGAFNSHTATYTFDGHGGRVLRLRDRDGRVYALQSIATNGCGIDAGLNGTYNAYTIDFVGETWLRGLPENAAAFGEPYDALEIIAYRGDAQPALWPNAPASVRINGTWGWPAVPRIIKDLVIHRTRELADAHKAGSTGELPAFDGPIPMRPNTTWLFKEAERLYGPGQIPGVA
jgi:hypothetical protein